MMRFDGWLLMGMLLTAGCGPAAPTLAGGKPVSHWLEALHAADPKERGEAAEELGRVGPADPSACPALIAALQDPDARVRGKAVVGLVQCGPAAKAAAPALQGLQAHDPDPGVRDYAAKALKKIQGE